MDQRISIVTLGVAELGRARSFYERLGWRGQEVEETVFFQAGAMVLVLWGRAKLAADSGVPDDGSGFDRVTLAQNVRSADEVDAGATVTRKPGATFYGGYRDAGQCAAVHGGGEDPRGEARQGPSRALDGTALDGHAWEIAFNPAFTITDDGAVVLPDF